MLPINTSLNTSLNASLNTVRQRILIAQRNLIANYQQYSSSQHHFIQAQMNQNDINGVNNINNANDVKLIAVSKTFSANYIREAIICGQYAFGENYVQEALPKIKALNEYRQQIEWHFIGRLQSNKIALIAENFDWVQSVDSIHLAEKLSKKLSEMHTNKAKPLNVCIQVNISLEKNKNGVFPNETIHLANQVRQLPHLCLRGLMAVPANLANTKCIDHYLKNDQTKSPNFIYQNNQYDEIAKLFVQLKERDKNIDTLSLGMSADLEQAILAGSTMVRIGSAIFGKRC